MRFCRRPTLSEDISGRCSMNIWVSRRLWSSARADRTPLRVASTSENAERLPVQTCVPRGDDAPPIERGLTVPSCDDAAGVFNDGDQRAHVVGLEASFHDQIHKTSCQKTIAIAVATK